MPPLDINSLIGSAAGGGLAIVIIRLVFGFLSRRDVTFADVLKTISVNIAAQTEILRGLSSEIKDIKCRKIR